MLSEFSYGSVLWIWLPSSLHPDLLQLASWLIIESILLLFLLLPQNLWNADPDPLKVLDLVFVVFVWLSPSYGKRGGLHLQTLVIVLFFLFLLLFWRVVLLEPGVWGSLFGLCLILSCLGAFLFGNAHQCLCCNTDMFTLESLSQTAVEKCGHSYLFAWKATKSHGGIGSTSSSTCSIVIVWYNFRIVVIVVEVQKRPGFV